jgi:hypothetical protein
MGGEVVPEIIDTRTPVVERESAVFKAYTKSPLKPHDIVMLSIGPLKKIIPVRQPVIQD